MTECSIVCPGPSIHETWEGISVRPIFAVKAAHEFLIARGIVPDYAVSSESVERTKWKKHEGVKYLCGHAGTQKKYGGKILGPPGSWCSTKFLIWRDMRVRQCPSGYYAVFCAYMLGFRTMHLFGMDGRPKAVRGQLRGFRDSTGIEYVIHGPDNITRRAA